MATKATLGSGSSSVGTSSATSRSGARKKVPKRDVWMAVVVMTPSPLRVASSVYWNAVVQGLFIQDVWMGLIKPFFLGFAIVSIGCHVGLRTSGGTQGVGRATTNAVVAASVAVLAVDFFLTRVLITLLY